ADDVLFTENETNTARLFGAANASPFVKDAIHEYLVHGRRDAVNPAQLGTKAALHYMRDVPGGGEVVIRLRLTQHGKVSAAFDAAFDATFKSRIEEADAFYRRVTPHPLPDDMRSVQRQAFAGMLWSKQYYRFFVNRWLEGDPAQPPPPATRRQGRNHDWGHLAAGDVLAMPDKWEYPWFASWDMAFHAIAFAMIDPDFAKEQLLLLTREWYMHPNGQIPAYEWAFGDVNPPVHAWAASRVFQIEEKFYGRRDRGFLERVFQKLLLNFTWWVNRKDTTGNNIFEGGFLGLDNISIFDRTSGLPDGGRLEQADGTSWMAMYCLNLLGIALELAKEDPVYEDIATKFFEHFVYIGAAVNQSCGGGGGLWDEERGFYFDVLRLSGDRLIPIRAQTIAGLTPLYAVAVADRSALAAFTDFGNRFRWFSTYRPELLAGLADLTRLGIDDRVRLSVVDNEKLARMLVPTLDPDGMLSPHGIRSVSRRHAADPFKLTLDGALLELDYVPAESTSALFGGNSNWRGPVWFPLNFLLIEALQKHDYYLGETFKVECPSGSGDPMTLWQVSMDLTGRLIALFTRDAAGRRPAHGNREKFQTDPYWKDLVLFYEYFDGDTGAGLGASHQTGWTGIVAKLIHQYAEYALPDDRKAAERKVGFAEWDQRR
ncbi:MAG: glucosidase, partial [Betaproteobacteria bacterium]